MPDFSLRAILNVLLAQKEILSRKYHVSKIGVFGSVARGDFTTNSDVDLLVEFDAPVGLEFVSLALFLEALLGRKVDLISKRGLRPKYLKLIEQEVVYA